MTQELTRRTILQLFGATTAAATIIRHATAAEITVLPPATVAPALDGAISAAEETASVQECLSRRATPLESFLRARGITTKLLAHESGYTRTHLRNVRTGRTTPTITCIAGIVVAIRRINREHVHPQDLFERHILRTAWHTDSPVDEHERDEIRAAFGKRAARQFRHIPYG